MPLLLVASVSQCVLKSSASSAEDDAVVLKMAKQCNDLKDVFEKLESSQGKTFLLQHLKAFLSLAYYFDVRTLVTVLSQSRVIDPTLKDYLPRAIKKLRRYREISISLANAARTRSHGLFNSITVQSIDPPDLSVDLGTLTTALQNFEAVWSGAADEDLRGQPHRLREETRAKYHKRIRDNCTEFKVHAEVQILYFYEQQPHGPLPRAISSSKSACFLCNLFLEIHGKIILPRTHGRLYDKWTLPPPSAIKPETMKRLLPVVQRFNRALEAKTLQALKGEIIHYKPPNESVLAIYDPWSSHSTVVPRQTAQGCEPGEDAVPPDEPENEPLRSHHNPEATSQTSASSSDISVSIRSNRKTCSTILGKGECVCKDLKQGDSICVHTIAIHFQISLSDDNVSDSARLGTELEFYRVHVEHLWENSKLNPHVRVLDVDHLRCDQSEVICFDRRSSLNRLLCCSGANKVELTFEKVGGRSYASH